MVRDLLLLACSASKRVWPVAPLPAIERYDGVFFRVLRKRLREHPDLTRVDVWIISARFGLIDAATRIPCYDQRMNAQRAADLAPQVQSALRQLLQRNRYHRIFVNVGRDYLATFAGVEELKFGSWASGGIGQRAQQMKRWLEASQ
jgi:uncharacterized protein DUF6884